MILKEYECECKFSGFFERFSKAKVIYTIDHYIHFIQIKNGYR